MNSELNYYYDHNDDCYSVQLEGSQMTPRATKVSFIIISKQISYRLSATQTIL